MDGDPRTPSPPARCCRSSHRSIRRGTGSRSQSAAALRWLSTAPAPACQHRREPSSLPAAAVDGRPRRRHDASGAGVPIGHDARHRSLGHPGGRQLGKVDHPVLASREACDLSGRSVWRVSYPYGSIKRHGQGFAPRPLGWADPLDLRKPPGATPHKIRSMAAVPSVSAQFSVTVRVELDARQEPLGKLTAQIAEAGGRCRAWTWCPGRAARESGCGSSRSTPGTRRTGRRSCARSGPRGAPGARLRRSHDADASRRQDRAAEQVPAEDSRRPLDGLHARRGPGLPADRRRPLEGVRVHDQAQYGGRGLRRQRGARPRRHRPGGGDARDGGQGDAVQGVRRTWTRSRSASAPTTRTRSSTR